MTLFQLLCNYQKKFPMKQFKNDYFFRTIIIMLLSATVGDIFCQTTGTDLRPQFLFSDFSTGKVKMKNGQVNETMLNYNTVTEKMVFVKDGRYFNITNFEMVDTLYLNDRVFVPEGNYFNEVLLVGPVSLFARYKGRLEGSPSAYGTKSEASSNYNLSYISLRQEGGILTLPPDCSVEDRTEFRIRKSNEWFDFHNEKQFCKLFPEKSAELGNYIKENGLNIREAQDLQKLVKYCNSILQ